MGEQTEAWKAMAKRYARTIEEYQARIAALQADNERLREALQDIVDADACDNDGRGCNNWSKAEAALKGASNEERRKRKGGG